MDSINLESIYDLVIAKAIDFAGALVVLIIGLIIIKAIVNSVKKIIEKKEIDQTKTGFLVSLVSIGLKVVLLITIANILGVETSSIIAVIGTAGLAIGLALQGSLSNVAGGFLIIFLKPFKQGDYIEAQGLAGSVHQINILNTVLKTPDNKTVYIPNAPLAGGNITNYSEEEFRRLDLVFGIGYGDDIDKAKSILQNIMDSEERVLKDKDNMLVVSELADSSVNIGFRVWCKGSDYWPLNFDFQERVKKEFDAQGISIPFPQRDLHIFNEK